MTAGVDAVPADPVRPLDRTRRAGRLVLDNVVLDPVRTGRLRRDGWPPGLAPVALVALAIAVIMVALATLAGPIRSRSSMTYLSPGQTVPEAAVPLVAAALVTALTCLYVAALHVRVLVRIPVLVVVVSIFVAPISYDGPVPSLLPVLLAPLLLLVLAVLRWRRSFHPTEVLVATALIGGGVAYTLAWRAVYYGPALPGVAFSALLQMSSMLWALAAPFAVLAGATVIELLASLATAVSSAAGGAVQRSTVGRRTAFAVVALLVLARAAELVWRFRTDEDYRPLDLALGSVVLLVPFLVLAGFAVAGRAPRSRYDADATLTDWTRYALLISALIVGLALWLVVPGRLSFSFGLPQVSRWLNAIPISSSLLVAAPLAILALLGVAVTTWRRTGRLPLLLPVFAWVLALREIYSLAGIIATTAGVLVIASILAVLIGVGQLVRGTLTVDRAVLLGSVLLLSGVYEWRGQVTEPLTALLALTGASVGLIVGMIWRLLTDNAFSHGDSPRFPRPARVLLVLAYAVFGATGVALVSLQGGVSDTDLRTFEYLGDSQVGLNLVTAVLLFQLVTALSPPRPSPGLA